MFPLSLISRITTACVLLMVTLPSADADDFTYVTNNGMIIITGYLGGGGDVVIPASIHTLPVASIKDSAFYNCVSMTSVTLPSSVTNIGSSAFAACSGLTGMTIPTNVASIGEGAFRSCLSLKTINVETGNLFYSSTGGVLFNKNQTMLLQCPGGKTGEFTVPSTVTSIGNSAFYNCSMLTDITLPSGLTSIGSSAFYACSSLTGMVLPNGVASIGASVFRYCSSLANITIPASVTSIGNYAFAFCTGLTNAPLPGSITSIGASAFDNSGRLTQMSIPANVTMIGNAAFAFCSSLASISVSEGNTSYSSTNGVLLDKSQSTIIQCPGGLTGALTIPSAVVTIGNSAFAYCAALSDVTLPPGLANIESSAFQSCTSLTNITIPGSVTNIGNMAFYGCTSMSTVTPPHSLITIGILAFYGCTSLTSITIPDTVTAIGSAAFDNSSGLTNITVDSGNSTYSSIDGVLFNKSATLLIRYPGGKVDDYAVPSNITTIASSAFDNSHQLTRVTISSGTTNIGNLSFHACFSLTAISVDSNNPAFSSQDGVLFDKSKTVLLHCPGGIAGHYTIPDSVTNIDTYAFSDCTNLTGVTIGTGINNLMAGTFSGCLNLITIDVAAGHPAFGSAGGVLFDKNLTTLVICPAGMAGSYTVPQGVTDISSSAFDSCARLTGISIPSSVTTIGNAAFAGCTRLTSVTISNGVISIGRTAFSSCSSLTHVKIPDSVTSIGSSAFYACSNLTSITLGRGVASIGDYAFASCANLIDIVCEGNRPVFNNSVFTSPGFPALQASLYYLPNSTGWDATFSGRPAFPWNPQVVSGDGTFGVRTNRFGFTFTNAGAPIIVVVACTNLIAPVWLPLSTNTLIGGSSYFSDPGCTNHPTRFYGFSTP